MIFTGLPVVSRPCMPAALMPMPCCPRLIRMAVEFRAVEQLAEDQRNLPLHDARAVVLHAGLVAVRPDAFDMDPNLRQNPRLFAGIQCVVDGFFDGGQQGLAGIVEAE